MDQDDRTFYFTAQTGEIRWDEPQAPSNFYRYKLPAHCLAKVKLASIEAFAKLQSGETPGSVPIYEPGFLDWLAQHDMGPVGADYKRGPGGGRSKR